MSSVFAEVTDILELLDSHPTQQLYDRQIQVTFGIPNGVAYRYQGLRVSAKFEKTVTGGPNKGKIQVYNLNAKSRAFSEQKKKDGSSALVVALNAGYGTNLTQIFIGDVTRVNTERSQSDIITTFEIGDGATSYKTSRADLSFDAGTLVKTAVQQVAASFGKKVGNLDAAGNGTFLHGASFSGLSRDHMDYLGNKQGFDWSIQDDTVVIVPKDQANNDNAILLTPDTGLIEIPQKKERGITFKCLLTGKIKPSALVSIHCEALTGNYVCQNVKIQIDNYGKEFYNEVEAIPFG